MSLVTPDTKKKKIALPSVLSNIRNAVRAGAEEGGRNDVEIRPLIGGAGNINNLVGVGKSSSYASDRLQMRDRSAIPLSGIPNPPLSSASPQRFGNRQTLPPRNVPSASAINNWSNTLQTYSERLGSQWKKRSNNERRRRRGVTINTQPILLVLGLFFIGVPILVTLFLLARKAVFGDEDLDTVATHEVPAHETLFDGLDTGVTKSELTGITSAQIMNGLKELTSEDIPIGSVENGVEMTDVKKGSIDEVADVGGVGANEAVVIANEAVVNEESTTEGDKKTQTAIESSNYLRGSNGDKQDTPASIEAGSFVQSSGLTNEKQFAPITPSDEKIFVNSKVEEEIADQASDPDERIVVGESITGGFVAKENESPDTNNEAVEGEEAGI